MDENQLERDIAEFRHPDGKFHAALKTAFKNDPELKKQFAALCLGENTAEATTPTPKPAGDQHEPPQLDSTSPDIAVGEQELRQRWGEQYDVNVQAARELAGALFDDELLSQVADAVGNHPDGIERLFQLKKELGGDFAEIKANNPSLAGISEAQIDLEAKKGTFKLFGIVGTRPTPLMLRVADKFRDMPEDQQKRILATISLKMKTKERK